MEVIRHFGNYSIIRSDYVQICGGDVCAAQILSSLEFWTVCELSKLPLCQDAWMYAPVLGGWLYVSIGELTDSLYGTFDKKEVFKSFKDLIKKGLVHLDTDGHMGLDIQPFHCHLNLQKIQQQVDDQLAKHYKRGAV